LSKPVYRVEGECRVPGYGDGGLQRTAEALASGLVARLAAVVPDGIEVAREGGAVSVSDGEWRSEKDFTRVLDGPPAHLPADFKARGIDEMDGEQDVVADGRDVVGGHLGLREAVAMAAGNVLSAVQDVVVERLRSPWPSDPQSLSDHVLPDANAGWEGAALRLWFGNPARPVLELPAISAGELGLSSDD
jgi:hypothetical protein